MPASTAGELVVRNAQTGERTLLLAGLRAPRNRSLPPSEAEPDGQGRPDRAERSEPQSGALDGWAERSYPGVSSHECRKVDHIDAERARFACSGTLAQTRDKAQLALASLFPHE